MKTLLKATAVIVLMMTMNSCTKKSTTPTTTTPTSTTPSFSASMGGTSTTFTGTASSGANYLTITGTGSNYTINIYDATPIATGTVSLGSNAGSYAAVKTGSNQLWETDATHTGTLTITTYNTSTNIVTGSFSFTAGPVSNTTTNLAVTAGAFANISF
jgi:hypothetical protein